MENDYFDAIKTINPNATWSMTNNDLDQITWLDGTTPIAKETIVAKFAELETEKEQAKAQKETDALAGNNKLLELGLTQAQVTAMTGYTPPVAE